MECVVLYVPLFNVIERCRLLTTHWPMNLRISCQNIIPYVAIENDCCAVRKCTKKKEVGCLPM